MKPTQAAPRPRPEPLARQHHPDDARRRHARRLHRRALGHRPDLEPDDLRQGDRRRRRLRRPDRRAHRAGTRGRGALLRARAHRPAPRRRRCSGRSTSAPTESTAASRSRSRRCSPTTPRRRSSRRPSSTASAEENLFIKIPGTEAGPHGDRGVDLRRDPGQRHPAVLDRAVPRRRRRLHARARAPGRGGARPRRRLGRLAVHQPLGRRGRPTRSPTSCATGSGSRSAGAPTGLPRAARLRPRDAPAQRGRAAAAAALGEHRDQGPGRLRRALHRGPRRAVHGQHDAREDAARVRRPRRGRRAAARRRRRRRARR